VGLLSRLLGPKARDPQEECAEELWQAYEALLPECEEMIVEPAARWTADMERPPLELGREGEERLRKELTYYICFLSTLHCQELLSDWRGFLDELHARALKGLPEGSQEELNSRYGSYTTAYDEGMGRNWHAVGRLFVSRLQGILGDVPRLLWSGATFAMLDLTRQAAQEVLKRLPGKATGEACPACGRSGYLEQVAFGEAGSIVICNSCLEHPAVRERLLGDFQSLFALAERGSPEGPKLIRQLADRHRMKEPEILASGEESRGDNPS
jgi:hypothetical protein